MPENGRIGWSAMAQEANKPVEHLPGVIAREIWPEDLRDVLTHTTKQASSEFVYDEELDAFRFSEDGRFAFCEEFANWELLAKRGWTLHF